MIAADGIDEDVGVTGGPRNSIAAGDRHGELHGGVQRYAMALRHKNRIDSSLGAQGHADRFAGLRIAKRRCAAGGLRQAAVFTNQNRLRHANRR